MRHSPQPVSVWRLSLLLLSILFLSACSQLQTMPVNPVEAQRMVFDSVTANKSPATVASYMVLDSQPGFHGHVVSFWMCRPAAPNAPAAAISGYAIVRKYRGGNQGIQTIMVGESGLPAEGSLIEFMTGSIKDRDQKNHFIFGRILSPEVQAVEVVYADGQRLRWPAGGQGFLLFRQEPVGWTQLNILGESEQILKTYNLTDETTTISERDESGKIDCPGDQTTIPLVEPTKRPTETTSTALVDQFTVTPFAIAADPSTTIPEATPTPPTLTGTVLSSNAGDTFVFARSGPGTNYKRVGSIRTGETIQIIGRNPQNDWWQIRTETLEGWVFSAYVHVEGDVLAIPCISTADVDCAPATVPAGNDQAITAIQVFLGNPNAPLVFQREDVNPNADMRNVLIYTDAQGSEYWVDREAIRVVQWMPQPVPDSGVTKSIEELHSLALTFAYHQSPMLAQNPASLTLRQMTKDGSHYAFRWEDQSITGHILPPFLQVIVRTDGEILQYMNTLDIWTKQ